MQGNRTELVRRLVPERPIILLAREPVADDRSLAIQDYEVDGELVIPMFSTEAAFQESIQGADLGRPAFAIARELLASLVRGDEVFLLDPRLATELRFTAREFQRAFPGKAGRSERGGSAEPGTEPD